jgi:hypothetical protein
MSQIQNDAQKAAADAKNAVTNARRHLVARVLDWLRGHPRTLIVIVAALTILAVTLGLARG